VSGRGSREIADNGRVCFRDEWIDTGAQMLAVCEMLEREGVEILGIGTLQLHAGADKIWETRNVFAADRVNTEG
jgi:hypothetical protein